MDSQTFLNIFQMCLTLIHNNVLKLNSNWIFSGLEGNKMFWYLLHSFFIETISFESPCLIHSVIELMVCWCLWEQMGDVYLLKQKLIL